MNIRRLKISVVDYYSGGFCRIFLCSKLSISEFRQVAIDSKTASHQLPQYVIDKKKAKLAVLPPGDATQFRNVCGLGQAAQENFTQTLAKIGTVEVVERSQLDAFMQEMKFQAGITSEVDANKFMQIAKGVDFVFVGAVSSAGVNASFTQEEDRERMFLRDRCTMQIPHAPSQERCWLITGLLLFLQAVSSRYSSLTARKLTYQEM